MPSKLRNLEVFEGSLVDSPANKHAQVMLFKRAAADSAGAKCPKCGESMGSSDACPNCGKAPKENPMAKVNKTETPAEPQTETPATEPETPAVAAAPAADETLKAELAKRDAQIAELTKTANDALAQAGAEREARLTAEYAKRAEEFVVLGKADEVGGWLRKIETALGAEEYAKFTTRVRAISAQLEKSELLKELGTSATQEGGNDPWSRIEAAASELRKSDSKLTKQQAIDKAIQENPKLYAEYRGASV